MKLQQAARCLDNVLWTFVLRFTYIILVTFIKDAFAMYLLILWAIIVSKQIEIKGLVLRFDDGL